MVVAAIVITRVVGPSTLWLAMQVVVATVRAGGLVAIAVDMLVVGLLTSLLV